MKPYAYSIIFFVLFLFACKKDEPEQKQQSIVAKDFFNPLSVGNYWVYKVEAEQGVYPNYTIQTSYDTVRITIDTMVNGITYYYLDEVAGYSYVGDSAGHIVFLGGGEFELGPTPNTIHFQDTTDGGFFYRIYKTGSIDTTITVPAGIFTCAESIWEMRYLHGDPPPPNPNPRPVYRYYAKNIGLVKYIYWYAAASGKVSRELVDYNFVP